MCIKTDILSTLTYFDLFDYPITQTEIILFSKNIHPNVDINHALYSLVLEKKVFTFDELYTLQDNPALIARRRKGNAEAKKLLVKAEEIAHLLSRFPFVRGVAVSGSLSKNFADETSDIDLFIITAKNRLWIARTLMHCLKKLSFLVNKQHLLCMNYFIDEEALEIKEKNIYTATEVATLLPLRGIGAFQSFFKHNAWCKDFLPNHSMRISYLKDIKKNFFRSCVEVCLDNFIGGMLDTALMKLTAQRWNNKKRKGLKNSKGIIMSMDVGKHYAKPDPVGFQEKLVSMYESRIFEILNPYRKTLKPVS